MTTRTNPIGSGTANITYNGPTEESAILNRLAFEMDVSRGELLRDLVLRGLQSISAEVAKSVEAVREERLRMKHGIACLCIGLFSVALSLIGGGDLRAAKPVRVRGGAVAKRREA